MPNVDWQTIATYLRDRAGSQEMLTWQSGVLLEMLSIDNTPTADLARAAENEERIFRIIEREIREVCGSEVKLERVPIDPVIDSDACYAPPYYAAGSDGRVPAAAEVYRQRCNLLGIFDGDRAAPYPAIYNAHIDTIGAHVAPRQHGGRVFGRGACDAKGQIVALLAQIRLLAELRERFGLCVLAPRVYQFVIDAQTGGNGSLSAARDPRWAAWEAIVAGASANQPLPANAGAVWFRMQLDAPQEHRHSPVVAVPHIVLEMEREGRKIREESDHPLFPPDHVQTNYGIVASFGHHPPAVNDHVAVILTAKVSANAERVRIRLTEVCDGCLSQYLERYGDKSGHIDAATGETMLEQHYRLTDQSEGDRLAYRLDVYGNAGHMGAIRECDNAILKLAYLLEGIHRLARQFPGLEPAGYLDKPPYEQQRSIVLEGGQSFGPSHKMADVCARIAAAARRGVIRYLDAEGFAHDLMVPKVTFDKLRAEPFATNSNSPVMQAFDFAFQQLGLAAIERRYWEASSDGRIFARAGHHVVTFGPGHLRHAHAQDEHIDLGELSESAAIGALVALKLGGE